MVYTLQADVGLFNLFLFNLNFSWGFAYFTLSLSKQVVISHSPYRCMVYTLQADVGFFCFKSYFMRVNIFYTLTLQPDFMFSLSMEMLGLHSPSRCWLFIILRFFHKVSYFILSLPKQVVGCHSPCRCLVYILQAYVGFFKICCFNRYFSWGLTSFIPSLSKQVVNSHSPNRCWLFHFLLFLMQFHIFYTNTLQAGLRFMLSMQMFGLHSPSRCCFF